MPLYVSSTCAHHQEVKIALHSLWYHYTYRWPSRAQVETGLNQSSLKPVHEMATYRCDDTRGCVVQFWSPDDEHMCSKHVEAWNKLIVQQKFFASSWLITEINILRCTVSKTSKRSEYVIYIDFKLQKWLRFTVVCVACLLITNFWTWSVTVNTIRTLSWIQVFCVVTLRRWYCYVWGKTKPAPHCRDPAIWTPKHQRGNVRHLFLCR